MNSFHLVAEQGELLSRDALAGLIVPFVEAQGGGWAYLA